MPLLLLALFILVPIAELYVIIKVGGEIGALPTIAILIADSVLGSMLLRSQGRAAWRRFNEAIAAGRAPGRETVDGALIIFGGALLLTPGFLTDIVGILFLLPPTRALVRAFLVRRVFGKIVFTMAMPPPPPTARRAGAYPPGHAPPGDDAVEGTAVEVEPPHLER